MRVAIVTESYLPDTNGVSHSVQRIIDHLTAAGHRPMVLAPEPADRSWTDRDAPCQVRRFAAFGMPGYAAFRVALPSRRVEAALAEFRPDIVHLASPFALGAWGAFAADRLGLPTVAVYQTDIAGFAGYYKLGVTRTAVWSWMRRIHELADRTLAPSRSAAADLVSHDIGRVHLWPRGVDASRFHPLRRDEAWRRRVAPDGEVIVGYVGRLAAEKNVERLEPLTHLPGVRVVVVGDGPVRGWLEQTMPKATFTGELTGTKLGEAYASLDAFVHTGAHETFCQSVQEAMAAGLPVIAPAVGGPVDLVADGDTGFLVPPDDPAALTSAVRRLVDDPALRVRFGQAGRNAVADRSWTSVNDTLLDHYRAVLAATSRVRAA